MSERDAQLRAPITAHLMTSGVLTDLCACLMEAKDRDVAQILSMTAIGEIGWKSRTLELLFDWLASEEEIQMDLTRDQRDVIALIGEHLDLRGGAVWLATDFRTSTRFLARIEERQVVIQGVGSAYGQAELDDDITQGFHDLSLVCRACQAQRESMALLIDRGVLA